MPSHGWTRNPQLHPRCRDISSVTNIEITDYLPSQQETQQDPFCRHKLKRVKRTIEHADKQAFILVAITNEHKKGKKNAQTQSAKTFFGENKKGENGRDKGFYIKMNR
ncbi:hypothetical protein PGTUg99_019349 [Puccinia graminis f. sp. tritici]|uniref:Uncharacterized protein n=1 Tax=Puccinia graminis f. sp. tritici TaxID=56615 RepID=A0A5B0S045_PUCGR|nr:hypothetical protein PGTUg99_019349 [Puccinia graminis f. sp. tritici]